MRSRCCLYVSMYPTIVARRRPGRSPLIVARQRLGENPTVGRQWLGKNPLIVARQRLSINFTAVTNTRETIEELLDASFPMWPVSYQG
jgi:hypothetical protein